MRRPVMAIVGWGGEVSPDVEAKAESLGRAAIDAGFRVVCGGLGGVMAAACRGARSSARHVDGDVIGLLPGADKASANPWVDIVVPTDLGHARNLLVVATGDVVVAVGGGAGTLSELALAWQLGRPVVALADAEGWGAKLAGTSIDGRRADVVHSAADAVAAAALARSLLDASTSGA